MDSIFKAHHDHGFLPPILLKLRCRREVLLILKLSSTKSLRDASIFAVLLFLNHNGIRISLMDGITQFASSLQVNFICLGTLKTGFKKPDSDLSVQVGNPVFTLCFVPSSELELTTVVLLHSKMSRQPQSVLRVYFPHALFLSPLEDYLDLVCRPSTYGSTYKTQ